MTRVLSGLLLLSVLLCAGVFWKYTQIDAQAREACSATGAAAKLDLSSFVPLCRRYQTTYELRQP